MLSPELHRFVELFVRWNASINLSASRTVADVTLQVVDCLALLPYVEGPRLLDVGSGGGLPGLVVAVSMPAIQVVSLEPVHKKAAFQSTAIRELGLKNAQVQARRVEADKDTGFDTVVSRATFALTEWLELGRKLARPGGVVLGMEGKEQHSLPEGAERIPYEHGDRTRAVIRYRV
ncbi:MAG TPA: 16S rRNA (guanine(527)-N(7))-methyltransferase RsmG [Kofleriaceae bacterium]|nr:16S rRNA (guanine(527)-N(7))-methyltransferase RsmG [Kofleriaceae bacterium]